MYNFDDLIGKPFKLFADGPDFYDCYGLVVEVSKRIGKPNPIPNWKTVVSRVEDAMKYCKELFEKVEKPEVGDVILMHGFGEHPHFGIIVSGTEFLHTSSRIGGVRRTNLSHPFYKLRILGYYRFAGI